MNSLRFNALSNLGNSQKAVKVEHAARVTGIFNENRTRPGKAAPPSSTPTVVSG